VAALFVLTLVLTLAALAPAQAKAPSVEPESGAPAPYKCAWPIVGGVDALNVALPDANATYWMHHYFLEPGMKFVIRGVYPFARFASFTTYDDTGTPLPSEEGGMLVDAEIDPEDGSGNPFASVDAPDKLSKRRYRVVIEPHADGSSANELSGLPSGIDSGWGAVVYRLYVPDDPRSLGGSVPLPEIAYFAAPGERRVLPLCKRTGGSARNATDTTAPPRAISMCWMVFCLPSSSAGEYPNPANAYVHAEAVFASGRVVVVTGKAPTFPDTRAGESPAVVKEMRYWSICENLGYPVLPVVACKLDSEIPLTPDRYYTVVVSASKDRPSNATTANGVAWLPWGDHSFPSADVLRNMLPDDAFCCSIQAATDSAGNFDPAVMGPYYPLVKYCTKAGFEADGAACVAQAP
jgi:hypothetical protein